MINKIVFISLLFFFTLQPMSNAQSVPEQWGNLKSGKYAVGFKSSIVFDTTRMYDLTCGDTTLVAKNKYRPILINRWYPAVKDNTQSMKVKEFFDFPENEDTKVFFSKLKAVQYENSKMYAVGQNLSKMDMVLEGDTSLAGRDQKRKLIFENYINATSISHRNANAIEGEFPIIIYHQGLGGTLDENYLLLEYLASNGYIVITSAFQVTDGSGYEGGWWTGVGEYETTFKDFSFIINYCKQNNLTKSKKVFLSGHSFGANCAITYIGEGNQNVDGLIPLDSDYGYVLSNFFPDNYNPFVKEKIKFYNNLPIFCIGRSFAHYRMLDSLTQSKRYFLTIAEMQHNDFAAQGGVGRYYCKQFAIEKEKYAQVHQNYLNMCNTLLKFTDSYAKNGKDLQKSDFTLYKGWKLEVSKKGEKSSLNASFISSQNNCPTISQFIDIMNNRGFEKMKEIYTVCSDTALKAKIDSDIFDYIYETNDSLKIVPYLDWMVEVGTADKNLYNISLLTD